MSAEKRLKALGIELPKVSSPVANYVNAVRTGNLLFLAGKGDALPPIAALGLFYDFRELTPIGRRGDEMIRRLADRLGRRTMLIVGVVLAGAGAIRTRSALSARAMCSTLNSEASSNISVTTGRPVMLRSVRGVTNFAAESVMTTSTRAPAWVNLLARSAAL